MLATTCNYRPSVKSYLSSVNFHTYLKPNTFHLLIFDSHKANEYSAPTWQTYRNVRTQSHRPKGNYGSGTAIRNIFRIPTYLLSGICKLSERRKMSNPNTKPSPAPTVVTRTLTGLLLFSLSFVTQAAPGEVHQFDLFSIQFTSNQQSQAAQLNSLYKPNTATPLYSRFMFGKIPHLPSFSDLRKGTLWTTSIRWHLSDEGSHTSLSPRFRIESKDSRVEIRPTQNSLSVTWRMSLQ